MRATLKQFITPHRVVYAAAVVSVIGVGAVLFFTRNTSTPTYSTVTYASIAQNVTGDGTVKASQSVDLGFQSSGRIASVQVSVGDHVSTGDTLATLSSADTGAQYQQARAALAVQVAKMQSLLAGTRPESIAVTQTSLVAAQNSLSQARATLIAFANDVYIKADDAIRNKSDMIMTNPRTSNPTLNLSYINTAASQVLIPERVSLEQGLVQFNAYLSSLPSDQSQVDSADLVIRTNALLVETNQYLDDVGNTLTQVVPSNAYPQVAIQSISTSITTARSSISTEISQFAAIKSSVQAAQTSVDAAKAQLALAQASSTPADIAAQQAQVEAAQANVAYAAAQLAKARILAPMDGIVTHNDAHIGATASPGQTLISMNSDARFQIEMYVSERDMSEVRVGDSATVTLDALTDSTGFPAHVASIDPAASDHNGASAYRIVLAFDKDDERIAAGESGTVSINTAEKDRALAVPTSAIIQRNSKFFVMKKTDHGVLLTPVTVGIQGATMTEVLSGLNANDKVQSFGLQE